MTGEDDPKSARRPAAGAAGREADSEEKHDAERLGKAIRQTGRFAYDNAFALVGVSLLWTLASLPVVTLGPATVGAYAAIRSLRADGHVDKRDVLATVRRQFLHATLLGVFPLLLGGVSLLYAAEFVRVGTTLALVLTVLSAYATFYTVLVLLPAFVALARGESALSALAEGRRRVSGQPTLSLAVALLTAAILVATALTTVGFAFLFPTLAFSLHAFLYDDLSDDTAGERRSQTLYRAETALYHHE
ncbi:YesL family protein [Haloprofundus salilacus]|uniref:YesL family protein n=1 Tax=Haloprofundus salilacus TaxID=2876190 RepID=UPI001CCE1092|nr:YesL family protein [Haloprofundus salilacus]